MQKSLVAKITLIIFIILLIGGSVCLFFIPSLYDLFKDGNVDNFSNHVIYYRIGFYLCYVLSLYIIYKLTRLFSLICKRSPFCKEVENSLKIIAILFMSLFLIIVIKSIFIPTLLSLAVFLVCFIASLSFYVLAEVIKAAIIYKDEVDYTV